jgi:hypothetical protein
MRRDKFISATTNLSNALSTSGVRDVLEHILNQPSKGTRESDPATLSTLLQCYGTFMTIYRGFSSSEKELMRVLDINSIVRPEFWTGAYVERGGAFYGLYQTVGFAVEILPKVASLLRRKTDSAEVFIKREENENPWPQTLILRQREYRSHPDNKAVCPNSGIRRRSVPCRE